jgi:serine/threonine protein kinase
MARHEDVDMTSETEPSQRAQPRTGSEGAALAWLDALVSGNCTAEEFLAAVRNQFQDDTDEHWELLSLLDQYYRRGKIKVEVFLMLKSRLEGPAHDDDEDVTASLAAAVAARLAVTPRPRPSTVVTAPVTASQRKAAPDSRSAAVDSRATAPDLRSAALDSRATAPGLRSAALDSRATAPDLRSAARDSRAAARDTRAAPPESRYTAPDSRSATSGVRSAAAREVAIGDVLRNRYRVVGVLGHGGMATVFEAVDEYRVDLPTTSQRLAVKVLHTAVTQREELLSELQREFQHLQLLSHPNIVRVHEFDRDGDIAFFTMEFLDGALLSQVLGARKGVALSRPYTLATMRDVGAALAHAHSRGVLHGDINPQNIFITNNGELRVLDFGASHQILRDRWNTDTRLSERAPVATPGYASCQLLEGQYPDARDDVFAFACVAYVLLSGRHPFPNRTAVEACAQRLRPPRPPRITNQQWRVLREGLRWERDRRPADVQQWLDRFDLTGAAPRLPKPSLLVNTPPPSKLNVKRAAAGVLAAALLAAVGFWAVTNYDSLQQQVAEWTGRARSAVEDAGKSPTVPAPVPEAPVAEVPGAEAPPPIASAAPSPPPAAHSNSANSALSQLTASPIPAAPLSAAPRPRLSAPARAVAADAPAHGSNAGPARIELASDTVDVQTPDTTAGIVVHRKGNLHGYADFTWWTESGTAKPGQDFAPVTPRLGRIGDGEASVNLTISVSGTPRTKPKSFYVVIDRTDSGPALGARTLTMVTLQPPD